MVKRDVVVKLITGLHARPAANLVKLANTFRSNIVLIRGATEINAKDIWEVLNNGVESGDSITIKCDGEDENAAIDKIQAFINDEEVS